ncbi:DNA helicase RecD, partial [Streptomyces sp. ECR3]
MSTDPETTETAAETAEPADSAAPTASAEPATSAEAEDTEGPGKAENAGNPSPELSEAEAELEAQRQERERIERRKAAKQGPVESGAKLSGTAADLLAAVRAVESGAKPVAGAFSEPPPAPRRA